MTDLVVCLTTGKGSFAIVGKLIRETEWTNIFVITNPFGYEKFTCDKKINKILINPDGPIPDMKKMIRESLKGKMNDFEVALNLSSGMGPEHMAILAAIIESGLSFRLIVPKDNATGFDELLGLNL